VTNQVPYSLFNRQYVRNGVLAHCQASDILLTAYTPVEEGRVSNHSIVQKIARKHNATPVQVALSWLVSQPKVITIPMSTNLKHLEENLSAVEVALSEEEIVLLDKLDYV
jgi:diketogulonate reductase-like aldo/keto reductase